MCVRCLNSEESMRERQKVREKTENKKYIIRMCALYSDMFFVIFVMYYYSVHLSFCSLKYVGICKCVGKNCHSCYRIKMRPISYFFIMIILSTSHFRIPFFYSLCSFFLLFQRVIHTALDFMT